jgi:hypothetical protein
MITIKINGKKEKIPTANELTVRQYIKLVEKEEFNIINYLSACLEKEYKVVFNSKIKGFEYLGKRIGEIEDYTKIKMDDYLILQNGEIHTVSILGISTIGERFMIEENARKLKAEEFLCFILAICIINEKDKMNYGKINDMKEYLMEQPYKKILPVAFFLLQNLKLGNKKGMKFFNLLKLLIRTLVLRFRLGLKNFQYILTTMKYKRYVNYLTNQTNK